MEQRKRERSELENPLNIPMYGGALIACEQKAALYKKLRGYTFYTIDNQITFKVDGIRPSFIVVGQVGVSDDEALFKGFINVMDFLGYKVELQSELPLFDGEATLLQ